MAYCRWSSDCYQCDVYVYESRSGFQTHVATRRREKPPKDLLDMPEFDSDQYIAKHKAIMNWLDTLDIDNDDQWIELSEISNFAGMSFLDVEPGACARRLELIRADGLNVPQYAVDELRDEQKMMDGES